MFRWYPWYVTQEMLDDVVVPPIDWARHFRDAFVSIGVDQIDCLPAAEIVSQEFA